MFSGLALPPQEPGGQDIQHMQSRNMGHCIWSHMVPYPKHCDFDVGKVTLGDQTALTIPGQGHGTATLAWSFNALTSLNFASPKPRLLPRSSSLFSLQPSSRSFLPGGVTGR
jgi:hypothetical protein